MVFLLDRFYYFVQDEIEFLNFSILNQVRSIAGKYHKTNIYTQVPHTVPVSPEQLGWTIQLQLTWQWSSRHLLVERVDLTEAVMLWLVCSCSQSRGSLSWLVPDGASCLVHSRCLQNRLMREKHSWLGAFTTNKCESNVNSFEKVS